MTSHAFSIALPGDFNFPECLWFLDRGYDECLYTLKDQKVFRLVKLENRLIPFCISLGEKELLIETAFALDSSEKILLKQFITQWFDLDKKLDAFYELLLKQSFFAYMPQTFKGLRLVGIPDLFEALCWSIIGQQINLTFAYKLKRRLVENYGSSVDWNGITLHHFPEPEALVSMDEDFLRSQQFSRSKINYLKNTAEAFASGLVSKEKLKALPDFTSRQKMLTQIKGIGVWSANYALMKSLNEPGSIPFGDVGLLQALQNHGVIKERNEHETIQKLFDQFPDWQAYLVFYLWRSLSHNLNLDS